MPSDFCAEWATPRGRRLAYLQEQRFTLQRKPKGGRISLYAASIWGISAKVSHIFISYVREDHLLVDKLVSDLEAKGALIWLDREAIKPGELWQKALKEAIQEGNFFIACFSQNSVKKTKNYMNEELRIAVGELRKMPHGAIWFIPVLLDRCAVPDFPIDSNTSLRDIQRVSLADNWNEGVMRIATITLDLEKKKLETK